MKAIGTTAESVLEWNAKSTAVTIPCTSDVQGLIE
jgi:hypothetical protein